MCLTCVAIFCLCWWWYGGMREAHKHKSPHFSWDVSFLPRQSFLGPLAFAFFLCSARDKYALPLPRHTSGLVTNLILFCWPFYLVKRCDFSQTHNQGLDHFLTGSWDLNTPDWTAMHWLRVFERCHVSSKSPFVVFQSPRMGCYCFWEEWKRTIFSHWYALQRNQWFFSKTSKLKKLLSGQSCWSNSHQLQSHP